jgi:tetratricopeptide (TPR) repeat protein
MRLSVTVLVLLAMFVVAAPGWTQEPQTPAWLLYEEGNSLFHAREFGMALQRYKDAVAMAGILPEAEAAIGDVYREEGELELARTQYEKAYSHRNTLVVPLARYGILYRIAEIDRDRELYKLMEDTLHQIIADDANWGKGTATRLRDQVESNYYARGLDQVLRLYRFDASFASPAHAQLGWFYYRTGRFPQAVLHCLYAAVYAASEVARFSRERDVEWEFDSFEKLVASIDGERALSDFAAEAGLFRNLYYLAGSTYAAMYPKQANSLWKLVSTSASAGEFAELSKRQLRKPWIEPYLVPMKAPAGKP